MCTLSDYNIQQESVVHVVLRDLRRCSVEPTLDAALADEFKECIGFGFFPRLLG